jgi:DNA invertase Pin-like site-specific DNA recombinase
MGADQMSSLVTTLLFGNPISLPTGTRRAPHIAGFYEPETVVEADYKKRLALRESNIALVLAAIKEGADTTQVIAKRTSLSKSTVLKAVNRLNDRGHIVRTIRKNKITKPTYHWRAVKEQFK